MATQLALSLVLVANAGLLVRSLQVLRGQDLGFDIEGLTVGHLAPNGEHYVNVDAATYAPRLLEQVDSLPAVKDAALFYTSPGFDEERPVAPSSAPATAAGEIQANFNSVSPTFFATIGIPLLSGRRFSWQDDSSAPRVAIVSKTLARQLFPAGDALGQTVRLGTNRDQARIEIVGTVADAALYDPTSESRAAIYVPQLQTGDLANWHDLIIRTTPGQSVDFPALQQAVESLGHAHVMNTVTVQHLFGGALLEQRVSALLGLFFGTLALLLAAIGLYGLVAYAVTLRTREMGIRLALGARLRTIVALVLGDGLRLALVGLALGLGGVFATTRLLRSMLYGIGPDDALTIGVSLALLLGVALVACLIPALRAGRVDPAITLRAE
jgi:putative ABC transport system permease protein